jgi:hypothetical protein
LHGPRHDRHPNEEGTDASHTNRLQPMDMIVPGIAIVVLMWLVLR